MLLFRQSINSHADVNLCNVRCCLLNILYKTTLKLLMNGNRAIVKSIELIICMMLCNLVHILILYICTLKSLCLEIRP